jgi:50S ribosomal subunit-associated GTPase HflX
VVANKTDMEKDRIITFEEGKQFAKNFKLDYIEVSAKTGININILFEILCKSMIKKCEYDEFKKIRRKGDRSYFTDKSKIIYEVDEKRDKKNKGCC